MFFLYFWGLGGSKKGVKGWKSLTPIYIGCVRQYLHSIPRTGKWGQGHQNHVHYIK